MDENFTFQLISGKDDALVDVIFIHGLGGDAQDTWTNSKSAEKQPFWPSWLSDDIDRAAVYTLGYPSSWFTKWAKKEMNLYERAKLVLEALSGYGLGDRPLVLICHSLGGLLGKQILRTALEAKDEGWRSIATSIRQIFFIATPHSGTSLGNILKQLGLGLTSTHIDALTTDNDEMVQLNEACRMNCGEIGAAVYCYYEMYAMKGVVVVPRESADPGIGSHAPVPIDADHVEIARPLGRHSPLYLGINRRIRELIESQILEDPFDSGALARSSKVDRRDLFEKLQVAGREHEYRRANEAQTSFAVAYAKSGLRTEKKRLNDALLADVEDRFLTDVYHREIRIGASEERIDEVVRESVIEPLAEKYRSSGATARTIRSAIYFLSEKCHIRWDRE